MTVFWAVAAGSFALDRLGKWLALQLLAPGARVEVWAGVLEWRLTRNSGMALGLFAGFPWLTAVLPVLMVLVGWLVLRRYPPTPYRRVAAALVLGGFLGNYLDRLTVGFVTDMVYFPWMPWYICNGADIAITLGVGMLILNLLLRPDDWLLKAEGNTHAPHRPDSPA